MFAVIILKKNNLLTTLIALIGVIFLASFVQELSLKGLFLVLASRVTEGISFVLVSKIGDRDSPLVIFFHHSLFSFLLGFTLPLGNFKAVDYHLIPSILMFSLMGYLGQFFLTMAFQTGDPKKVTPLRYLEIIFTMVFGFVLMNESYSIIVIIGTLIILASILFSFLDADINGALEKEYFEILAFYLDLNKDGKVDYKDLVYGIKKLFKKGKQSE